MAIDSQFDDIRPYYDDEIPAAMKRITEDPYFPLLSQYVFPGKPLDEVREVFEGFNTIQDFQYCVMYAANQQIIARTTDGLTCGGIDLVDKDRSYMFVSNHRDIVLDSCMMMYLLFNNGKKVGEITFGANLMQGQLVIDLGRSNRMFRVERGGNMRDFYRSSRHLSEYMRHTIKDKNLPVWIAQRNGRTKDGIDRTDQGIIKMFGMSGGKDRVEALAELNILPVAVSYEWEPCDVLKAVELYKSQDGTPYVKQPGEDLNSILTGITQYKGRVHMEFCKPVTREDLEAFNDVPDAQFHRCVANLIDQRITEGYHKFENAYIAADLINGDSGYSNLYSDEQKAKFLKNMERLQEVTDCNQEELRRIFLGIYGNPICRPLEKMEF